MYRFLCFSYHDSISVKFNLASDIPKQPGTLTLNKLQINEPWTLNVQRGDEELILVGALGEKFNYG
jgi:hypothetical protein